MRLRRHHLLSHKTQNRETHASPTYTPVLPLGCSARPQVTPSRSQGDIACSRPVHEDRTVHPHNQRKAPIPNRHGHNRYTSLQSYSDHPSADPEPVQSIGAMAGHPRAAPMPHNARVRLLEPRALAPLSLLIRSCPCSMWVKDNKAWYPLPPAPDWFTVLTPGTSSLAYYCLPAHNGRVRLRTHQTRSQCSREGSFTAACTQCLTTPHKPPCGRSVKPVLGYCTDAERNSLNEGWTLPLP